MGKHLAILVSVTGLVACKTTTLSSNVKDIGVMNTQDASTKVVYEDQGKVYLKTCKPPQAPPLDRNCATDQTPKHLESSVYLYKLPFDVGPYQRDAQGLALVTKALKDANDAVAGGNQNAMSTVQQLTPIELNLKKILAIKEELQANHKDLTYYQYQDEFSKLLAPFGDNASDSTSISGMNFIQIPGQGFAMQETEVTRGQWKAIIGCYPEELKATGIGCAMAGEPRNACSPSVLVDDHPVSCVSAHDAQSFADEMTRKNDGHTYRLPSEQEWVAAAGNIEGPAYGWCNVNSTQPIKRLKAQNGLYDMVGNVVEWTSSNWGSVYPTSNRVVRGGSWANYPQSCRAASRDSWEPEYRYRHVGFRLLRHP